MINLLPTEYKKEIAQEENWKLVMILGILVLFFFICLSLILLSVKIFVSGETEAQKILVEQKEKELLAPQMQALQQNLTNFNQTLFQLESFYQNQFKITKTLEQISTVFPSEIYLTNLSVSPQIKEEGGWQTSYNISGFSPDRDKLLKLKENLDKEGSFQEVYFPPVSWMKIANINFTATFKSK